MAVGGRQRNRNGGAIRCDSNGPRGRKRVAIEGQSERQASPLNPSAVAFRLIMPSETGYMFMAGRGFQMVS